MTSTVEDGKLKIKTVSETPEIRNLSDQSLNHQEELRNNASGADEDESDDGSESKNSVDRTNDVVTIQSSKDTKQQEQSNSKQLSNNCTLCQAHLLCCRFL